MARTGRPRTALYVPWVATRRVNHARILCGGDPRLKEGSPGITRGALHGVCPNCGGFMHPKGRYKGALTWRCGLCDKRVCSGMRGNTLILKGVSTLGDLYRRIDDANERLLELRAVKEDAEVEMSKLEHEIVESWSTLSYLTSVGISAPVPAPVPAPFEGGLDRLASIIQDSLRNLDPTMLEDAKQELMALLLDGTQPLDQVPQLMRATLRRLRGEQEGYWGIRSLDESRPSLSEDYPPLIERIAGRPDDDPQVLYES